MIDNTLDLVDQGVDKAKEYFGGIDVDEEIKDLWDDTMEKIKDLNLDQEWEKLQNKVNVDDILKKFGKTLNEGGQNGEKEFEDYFSKLIKENPDAKSELEEIKEPMMAAIRKKQNTENTAAFVKSNIIMVLILSLLFPYF